MSMSEDTNKLYTAAVGYMVAEKSNENSWAGLVECAVQHISAKINKMASIDEVTNEALAFSFRTEMLSVVEQQIKKDFNITAMPAAWRSAKSTVVAAIKAGVDLVKNEPRSVRGKTEVEKEIKNAKAHTKPKEPPEKSPGDSAIYTLNKLIDMVSRTTGDFSEPEKQELRALCATLNTLICAL